MKPKTVGRNESGQTPNLRAQACNVGLMPGTIVITSDGEIPVEYLSPGDRIVTRNAGFVRLKAIEPVLETTEVVKFLAGSLGEGRPARDIALPASQLVLMRDWITKALLGAKQAVIPAGCMVGGPSITSLGPQSVRLLRLVFDAHYVIYADGLELSIPSTANEAVAAA